jgi:HAD superfamily hydrolase (TIGR01509 family)
MRIARSLTRQLLTPYGHDVTAEWYEKNVHGGADKEIFARLMPPGSDLEAIAKQKDDLFVEVYQARVKAQGLPMIEGLPSALALAESLGIRACAVTNAPRGAVEACISSLKAAIPAAKIIEGLVIGAECARAKPFPEPYLAGMAVLGVEPSSCVVFEDSRSGTRAGVAAKCHVVGICSALGQEQLAAVGASLSINNWSELTAEFLNRAIDTPLSVREPQLISLKSMEDMRVARDE